MERPTILDLQFLLSRLVEGQEFSFRELEILERTTYGLHQPGFISSEMANLSNQIWLVFGQQGQQYLPALSYLITHFRYEGTRLMALSTLAQRINRSWSSIDQSNKSNIKQYIVCVINDTVIVETSKERDTLLARANEVLVAMLKHEWTGLFKDFIANMLEDEETPTNKMVNNFSILTLLLHQGLDSWDGNMTAQEAETFRSSIDDDMRNILKIACRVLQNKASMDRRLMISHCLQMLSETMECMPAYELFNCNLIELLLELLEQRQFEKQLQRCFQSIFNFRERTSNNENHSKIARKLLLVLQVLLHRHEERSRPVTHPDKQSTSTQDSLDERKMSSRRETAHQLSLQVLELLYQFLCRYVPYMDRTPEQNDVEVQFDGFTKIHFSKELYESMGRIYWKMVNFLNRFISLYVKFNLSPDEDEEINEREFKVVECAKLLLVLVGKLKMLPQTQLSILLEQLLLALTPISKEFSKFYLSFGLIIHAGVTYNECRSFGIESSSQFTALMEVIMKDPKLTKIYADIIENQLQNIKKIESTETYGGKSENIPPKDLKSLTAQSQTEMQRALNMVNRLTWSMVTASSLHESLGQKIPINTYINSFIKKTQTLDASKLLLKKCYSLNSKYLMMAYPLSLTLASHRSAVFGCLETTKNDLMNEYIILMLSKMLINPQFGVLGIESSEMKLLIQKTHEVEKGGVHAEELVGIYPAFVCFFLKKIAADSAKDGNMKALIYQLIEKEKEELLPFAKQEMLVTEGPDINRCLFYFAKLTAIADHLIAVANSPEAAGVKGLNFLIKNHINLLKETINQFEYKYFLYSKHLKGQTRQSFQNSSINQFRCAYNTLVCEHVELTIIKTKLEAPNPELGSHQKRRAIIDQRSEYMGRCWQTLSKDFHLQTEFKCEQYLSLAVRYYRWLIYTKHPHSHNVINYSITEICACLDEESCQKYEYLKLKKYAFWKEVVELFLFHLTDDNCQQLMKVFEEVSNASVNLSATNVETVLELQQLVFNILNDHCDDDELEQTPTVWSYIISIFKNTFADLFSYTKNQNFFKRISHIFHQQIILASRWSRPIFRDSREQQGKSNSEVLFLYLQNFVLNNVAMTNPEQEYHSDLLIRLFKQKKQSIFVDRLRDYVISVNRMAANSSKLPGVSG